MWILLSFLSLSLSLFLSFYFSTCPGNPATMLWVSQARHVERQNIVFLPTAPAKIPGNSKHQPPDRKVNEPADIPAPRCGVCDWDADIMEWRQTIPFAPFLNSWPTEAMGILNNCFILIINGIICYTPTVTRTKPIILSNIPQFVFAQCQICFSIFLFFRYWLKFKVVKCSMVQAMIF